MAATQTTADGTEDLPSNVAAEEDGGDGDPSPTATRGGGGSGSRPRDAADDAPRAERGRTLRRILSLMASPLTDDEGSFLSVVAGLTTVFLVGACLGLTAPPDRSLSPSYRRISSAIGYIYFVAWSVSFYPQVISNFQRRSTVGLSPDFVVLNVIGFGCYAAYNACLFWSPYIRRLYEEKYGSEAEITVQSNDVASSIHNLVLSVVTLLQILWYYATSSNNNNNNRDDGVASTVRLSRPIILVIIGIATICGGYAVLVVLDSQFKGFNDDRLATFNWLDFLYVLSYIKIFISVIKYIPQVVLNFRRKSTVGWSIWNILLDLTGGILSDLQLVLDCRDRGDFSGITRNKAKLALGSLSVVFDLVFLVQHYCLYSGATASAEQLEPLLPPPLLPPPSPPSGGENEDEDGSDLPPPAEPQTIFV